MCLIVILIERGSYGNLGEKLVRFLLDCEVIGNIIINSLYGIFGKLNMNMKNGIMDKVMFIVLFY